MKQKTPDDARLPESLHHALNLEERQPLPVGLLDAEAETPARTTHDLSQWLRLALAGMIVVGALAIVLRERPSPSMVHATTAAQGGVLGALKPTPGAQLSGPKISGDPAAFFCTLLPVAQEAQQRMLLGSHPQPHPWYVSMMLAQWAIEQGLTLPSATGYNLGNVSAINGLPSIPGGNAPGAPQRFAYAYTLDQGLDEYIITVENGLYDSVGAAWPQGPQAQAIALGESPWDAGHYEAASPGDSLLAVMTENQLTRFDATSAGTACPQ